MSDWDSWSKNQKNNWICEAVFGGRTRGDQECLLDHEWEQIPDYTGDWQTAIGLRDHLRKRLPCELRICFFQCLSRICFLRANARNLQPNELVMFENSNYELLWLQAEDIARATWESLRFHLQDDAVSR